MPRLSRKNDPDSVRARQQALGLPEVDLEPYAKAAEAATGLVSIPVSVAQLAVSLGEYELSADGEIVETGRTDEEVVVPLAHTEGGLTASVQRGAKAIAESGGCRIHEFHAPAIACALARQAKTRDDSTLFLRTGHARLAHGHMLWSAHIFGQRNRAEGQQRGPDSRDPT